MVLDSSSMRNLELTETLREKKNAVPSLEYWTRPNSDGCKAPENLD